MKETSTGTSMLRRRWVSYWKVESGARGKSIPKHPFPILLADSLPRVATPYATTRLQAKKPIRPMFAGRPKKQTPGFDVSRAPFSFLNSLLRMPAAVVTVTPPHRGHGFFCVGSRFFHEGDSEAAHVQRAGAKAAGDCGAPAGGGSGGYAMLLSALAVGRLAT